MARNLILCATILSTFPFTCWGQSQNVKDAIDVIVLFCVAGGDRIDVSGGGKVEGGIAIKKFGVTGEGDIHISKSEARGLVDGLRQELSKVTAGQASEARKCMQPYIDRIVNLILGTKQGNDTSELTATDPPFKKNAARIDIRDVLKVPLGTKMSDVDKLIEAPNWNTNKEGLLLYYQQKLF